MSETEKKLWKRVDMYCDVLHMIPFLRMVGVCNNLAFSCVDEDSDIDLFIVASRGRLFFVRTFATILFHLLGVRRHGKKVAGRFCLSFFVDDSALGLSPLSIDDDLYLAFWISSMVVLIDDGVSEEFFDSNRWAHRYFDTGLRFGTTHPVKSNLFLDLIRGVLSSIFSGGFGNSLEGLLSRWQIKRANKKQSRLSDASGIVVNEHVLKFHNVDRRKHYRDLWRKKFGDKKLTSQLFRELYS